MAQSEFVSWKDFSEQTEKLIDKIGDKFDEAIKPLDARLSKIEIEHNDCAPLRAAMQSTTRKLIGFGSKVFTGIVFVLFVALLRWLVKPEVFEILKKAIGL